MKRIINIFSINLVLILAMTAGSSCTHNNGDIGDWFGTWRVDELTINDEPDPEYAPPYMFFKFQSTLVMIVWPDDFNHVAPQYTGTWSQEGDHVTFNFDYNTLTPTPETHLGVITTLNILKLSRSVIELRYTADDGNTYYYKLKKWG